MQRLVLWWLLACGGAEPGVSVPDHPLGRVIAVEFVTPSTQVRSEEAPVAQRLFELLGPPEGWGPAGEQDCPSTPDLEVRVHRTVGEIATIRFCSPNSTGVLLLPPSTRHQLTLASARELRALSREALGKTP